MKIGSLLLSLGLLLTGCSYQFGYGDLPEKYSTISIPYVEGDNDGDLTNELIAGFSASGAFRYLPCGGALILRAKSVDVREDNIGFRYDRKKDGKLKDYIIPTETRLQASLEVTVVEAGSERIVLGPTLVHASIDFDHQFYSDRHTSNIYSMGQLVDIDSARETVMHPLNRRLAEKVVDLVINSW